MSLGLEGSLEAQLPLEAVIQVGPGGCAHCTQLLWKEWVRSGHILEVEWWERCDGEVHRGPSLQLPARLGVEGCTGLNYGGSLILVPCIGRGPLLPDLRVEVTSAGTVGS